MNVHDKVTLNVNVGGFPPGSQGKVLQVHPSGLIDVAITHAPDCTPDGGVPLLLQPQSKFDLGGVCG
jgi:hypothetical protein